jgi:hypothetical protein
MKRPQTNLSAALMARPSITPDELFKARVMPLSRNLIYAACNTGEIECIRIGRKIIIPTAPLRRKLGMEA